MIQSDADAVTPLATPRVNGWIVAALAAAGLVVGGEIFRRLDVYGSSSYFELDNSLLSGLTFALAGGLAAAYLRPGMKRAVGAGAVLAAGVAISAMVNASGHGYGPAVVMHGVEAAAAASGWLMLRNRGGLHQFYVLVAFALGMLWRDGSVLVAIGVPLDWLVSGGLMSSAISALPVVAAAWLAAIPSRPPGPVAGRIRQGQARQQVLYTADGQQVVVAGRSTSRTNSLAIASVILSTTGCVVTPLIGIILGHVARRRIAERGESGDGLALAGLIVGYVWLGLYIAGVGLLIISQHSRP